MKADFKEPRWRRCALCASLQHQREAVTHLAEAGGVGGMLSTKPSHLFIQLITYSPVHLLNEPNNSILFNAQHHFVYHVGVSVA